MQFSRRSTLIEGKPTWSLGVTMISLACDRHSMQGRFRERRRIAVARSSLQDRKTLSPRWWSPIVIPGRRRRSSRSGWPLGSDHEDGVRSKRMWKRRGGSFGLVPPSSQNPERRRGAYGLLLSAPAAGTYNDRWPCLSRTMLGLVSSSLALSV